MLWKLADWLRRLEPQAAHLRLGRRAERVAEKNLKRQGYRILARNLRMPTGEIDLLAEAPDRRTVVVVEVKAATGAMGDNGDVDEGPRPEWHVTMGKQRRLLSLAVQAARRFRLTGRPVRFDIVAVIVPERGRPIVRHWPGAFTA
jgi:putative endonuclease